MWNTGVAAEGIPVEVSRLDRLLGERTSHVKPN